MGMAIRVLGWIFSALIGSGLTIFILRRFADNWIKHLFDTKLADHQAVLASVSDSERYNYQRLIHDFNQYSSKKHDVYPELYKLILTAQGQIVGLMGFGYMIDFDKFSKDDAEKYLSTRSILPSEQRSILSLWDMDKRTAVNNLRHILRNIEIGHARSKWFEARAYCWSSSLYLSERVSEQVEKVFLLLNEYLVHVEIPGTQNGSFFGEKGEQISKVMDEVKILMKQELSIADY